MPQVQWGTMVKPHSHTSKILNFNLKPVLSVVQGCGNCLAYSKAWVQSILSDGAKGAAPEVTKYKVVHYISDTG